jgi:molecular chaperone DnaJ
MALATLEGNEDLDVAPGTQSGTVIQMRGHGMPALRGSARGTLFVHLEVVTPTKIDDKQAELLRELAKLRDEEQPGVRGEGPRQRLLQPAA